MKPKDVVDSESVRKATGVGDVSESLRKPQENDQDEMEVQLAAEAIETVFNDATTMEDLDKGETTSLRIKLCKPVCLFACLSVCVSVCLSVILGIT